jgi:hypothetical protein
MQDLYGNPIGAAKDFPLTIHRKRQAAILYHPKSGSYPAAGSPVGGLGGPMTGAMRSLM